jgi:hypothetical protein
MNATLLKIHARAKKFDEHRTYRLRLHLPSVVVLAPGSYAAREIIGGIQILHSRANAPGPLIGNAVIQLVSETESVASIDAIQELQPFGKAIFFASTT